MLGLAVAFAGAMAIVGAGRFEAGGARLVGNLLIVANSLSLLDLPGHLPRSAQPLSPLTVVTWTLIFGAIGVLPFGAVDLCRHAPTLSAAAGWA